MNLTQNTCFRLVDSDYTRVFVRAHDPPLVLLPLRFLFVDPPTDLLLLPPMGLPAPTGLLPPLLPFLRLDLPPPTKFDAYCAVAPPRLDGCSPCNTLKFDDNKDILFFSFLFFTLI